MSPIDFVARPREENHDDDYEDGKVLDQELMDGGFRENKRAIYRFSEGCKPGCINYKASHLRDWSPAMAIHTAMIRKSFLSAATKSILASILTLDMKRR
jgi:hypothetical protein